MGVVVFKSAFECTVRNGESNSVVGGSVLTANFMVLAGMVMSVGVPPCGVVSACAMVLAGVVSCGVELAIVVVGCGEAVMSLSRGGVSLVSFVSQITEVVKNVSSAMYTLSELG